MLDAADLTTSWLGSIPVGQVIAFLTFAGAVFGWMWTISKRTRPFREFFQDWRGEDARPGVPARPGVMERLQTIESRLADPPTRAEFAAVEKAVAGLPTRQEFEDVKTAVAGNSAVIELIGPVLHAQLTPGGDDETH